MTGEMVLSASALLGGCLTGFVPAAGWPGIVFAACAGAVAGGVAVVFAMRVSAGGNIRRPFSPRAGRAGAGFCRIPAMRSALCRSAATPAAVRSKRLAPRGSGRSGTVLRFRSKSGSFPKMSLRSWPDGRSCSAEKERKFFSNTAPTVPAAADILRCGSGARRTGTAAAPASSAM